MLIEAYDIVMASQRLTSVKTKAFGDETELDKVSDAPRIVWVPTTDIYTGPDMIADLPAIVDGLRVRLESIALRKAGCDVHLFTDYGPNGQRQMEELIREFINALHEELLSYSNFEIENATWFPRKALAQKHIEVVIPIRVFVPIWSSIPAQLLGSVKRNLLPLIEEE